MKNAQANIFTQFVTLEDFLEESRSRIFEYICPLCKGIYFNPVIDSCGHIFCEYCFSISYANTPICPIGNTPLPSPAKKFGFFSTILDKQKVNCRNKKTGCIWSGLYKDLYAHLNNECPKEKVKCLYDQCSMLMFREEYSAHILICEYRLIKCKDCHMIYISKTSCDHELICLKKSIECTQLCGQCIMRELLGEHIKKECVNTEVECPFAKYGCLDKFPRRELERRGNEGMGKHLLLLTQLFDELAEKTEGIEKRLLGIESRNRIREGSSDEKEIKREKNSNSISNSNCIQKPIDSISIKSDSNENISLLNKKRSLSKDKDVIYLIEEDSEIDITPINQITNQTDNNISLIVPKKEKHYIPLPVNYETKEEEVISVPDSSPSISNTKGNNLTIQANDNNNNNPFLLKSIVSPSKLSTDSLFDKINISKHIKIDNNKATYIKPFPFNHKYLLGSKFIETNSKNCITSWTITLLTKSYWIAFGICNKEQVLKNKRKFMSNDTDYNNASFLFSSNGYTWNCNVNEENNKGYEMSVMPEMDKGERLCFQYNPMTQELTMTYKEKSCTLHKVYSNEGDKLTICILFLHPGDEICVDDYKSVFHMQ